MVKIEDDNSHGVNGYINVENNTDDIFYDKEGSGVFRLGGGNDVFYFGDDSNTLIYICQPNEGNKLLMRFDPLKDTIRLVFGDSFFPDSVLTQEEKFDFFMQQGFIKSLDRGGTMIDFGDDIGSITVTDIAPDQFQSTNFDFVVTLI